MIRYMTLLQVRDSVAWWSLALTETTTARRPGWQYMKAILEAWLAAGKPTKNGKDEQAAKQKPDKPEMSQWKCSNERDYGNQNHNAESDCDAHRSRTSQQVPMSEAGVEIYVMAWADVPDSHLEAACKQWIVEGSWFPVPAQLRNIAIGMMPDTSYLTPAEAWEEAVKCRSEFYPGMGAAITALPIRGKDDPGHRRVGDAEKRRPLNKPSAPVTIPGSIKPSLSVRRLMPACCLAFGSSGTGWPPSTVRRLPALVKRP